MKKSELRNLIKEEIKSLNRKNLIREGLLDSIFGRIGNKRKKQIEKKLESDPEYQKLNKELEKVEKELENIHSSPEYQKLMQQLEDL